MSEFKEHADPLAHAGEGELLSQTLGVRPVAQNCSEPGGIDIGAVGDVDHGVIDANIPQGILKAEKVVKPEWPFQAKDDGGAVRAGFPGDFKSFHST